MTSLISVANITKTYDGKAVVNGVSFDVAAGSVTAIIGPSGSGKSTILRALNALSVPESGQIRIGEVKVDFASVPSEAQLSQLRGLTGTVFQGNHLFANLTALENVTLGPKVAQKRSASEVNAEGAVLLEKLGLADKLHAPVGSLSGGQQQRVGIARALALRPQVLLFDEPTSALDPELVAEVLESIRDLANSGWTMVLVTHEMRFARQIADQVIFVDKGIILERGTAGQVLDAPSQPRTQQFLSSLLSH
jgi:cystine transport system ATP-binding protein